MYVWWTLIFRDYTNHRRLAADENAFEEGLTEFSQECIRLSDRTLEKCQLKFGTKFVILPRKKYSWHIRHMALSSALARCCVTWFGSFHLLASSCLLVEWQIVSIVPLRFCSTSVSIALVTDWLLTDISHLSPNQPMPK